MSGERVVRDKIWFVDDGKLIKIGFTSSFLQRMEECWHIMPANLKNVREKAPLVTVESNEEMYSIPSPVTGNILEFSQKATNFPDKLVETDVVVKITRGPIKTKEKAKQTSTIDWWPDPGRNANFIVNDGVQAGPPPAPRNQNARLWNGDPIIQPARPVDPARIAEAERQRAQQQEAFQEVMAQIRAREGNNNNEGF